MKKLDYPKLSIIVPTYNRANCLKECLKSIINQNYPNLEIIITDDNSTDNTKEVAEEYIQKYPFIKYTKNTKYPKGPNGNKNNGLDYVTGDIIGIFDDDDTMIKDALKIMTDKLIIGNYDMIIGNCRIISNRYDNGDFSGVGFDKDCEIDWKEDVLCGKMGGEFWSIFKKEILNNKRFDTDLYGGEGTLWRGIMKNKKIYYIHKAVRNYKINENSVMHNMIDKADKAIKNYERDIEYYGKEMEKYCPCYLATIYKGAAYFAKLSNQYKKSFKYIFKSISLCPKYISAYIMLVVNFLPKNFIPFLTKIKVYFKK